MTRTVVATALALLAFASNSILCRLALRSGAIDPAEFTAVRLITGAVTLAAIVAWRERSAVPAQQPSWSSAGLLALYALPFSFAYVSLDAGIGALLLFAAVQLTMLGVSVRRGVQPRPLQWAGVVVAFLGVVYLVLPGLTAPPLASAALMVLAGVAWGLYSLAGRGSTDPLGQTARNFSRAVPFGVVACAVAWPLRTPAVDGLVWAALSGAVASGLGYAVWYTALRDLTAVTAAVVQLAVPIIAAIGGILLLDEKLTARLVVAAVLVLGGIGLTIPLPRRRALVLLLALGSGAFGCSGAHRSTTSGSPSDCGAKPTKATRERLPSGASSGIELLPAPDARGMDGRYAVSTLTASPPPRAKSAVVSRKIKAPGPDLSYPPSP